MSNQSMLYETYGLNNQAYNKETFQGPPEIFTPLTRQAYLFTTEYIAYYILRNNFHSKKIACITGSGDFAFNAYMYKAAAIDCVDICPIAGFFAELKMIAIKVFCYETFLQFFGLQSSLNYFKEALYQKLRQFISRQCRCFFDSLIIQQEESPLLRANIIIDKIKDNSKIVDANPYLSSEESYISAQESMKEISFHPLNVESFFKLSTKKYDFINLSNILCYPPYKHTVSANDRSINLITKAMGRLEKKGELITLFFGSWHNQAKALSHLHLKLRKKGFATSQFICPSITHPQDCLLLLSVKSNEDF